MASRSVRSLNVDGGNNAADAVRNCSTLSELHTVLPLSFRPSLAAYLTKIYRIATKTGNVNNTIVQYEKHISNGSFPPFIEKTIKEPKIQFSNEYDGSPEGRAVEATFKKIVKDARTSYLAEALKRKKEEQTVLIHLLRFDEKAWKAEVEATAERVAATLGATFVKDTENPKTPWTWSGTPIPNELKIEAQGLWFAGSTYHTKAIGIARAAADKALIQRVKNLTMKERTESSKMDIDSKERSVKDTIEDALKKFKQELSSGAISTLPSVKRRRDTLTSNSREEQDHRSVKRRTEEGSKTQWWQEQRACQQAPAKKEECEAEKELTVPAFLAQCSKEFRPWLGETFPPVYSELSDRTRMKIEFALMKTWEADSIRSAKPGVFQHEDVSLPEEIEFSLSVNHKFILHQEPLKHDVDEAKEQFRRTVRTRWLFRDKTDSDFIAKFHVKNDQWDPPPASRSIEQGINEAMVVLDNSVSRAYASIPSYPAHLSIKWNAVRDYLADYRLLVKLTDKNLGLAVFPISWYDAKILLMLSDKSTYEWVTDVPTPALVEKLMKLVKKWHLPANMTKYITHRTKTELPQFHAIPKVHKNPWTLRPIVPSHSWVTSCVSTVLDHLLQPILKQIPWIVSSSKEVIVRLQEVKLNPGKPLWILTGDVVSFYTNIPIEECELILSGAWSHFAGDSSIDKSTIRSMVKFIMENNYLEYQGEKFRQRNGLAMGTSSAPVIANIYAARHENSLQLHKDPRVRFYGRYIDDCLCLFQGTREEVQEFCDNFRIGPLEVTWSISDARDSFLDIELIVGAWPDTCAVHTRLFRKHLNKHLYIPWSSAHPLAVKKGFVKAELTRLVILCSRSGYFADARQEFYGNLRRRGYPPKELDEWFTQVSYRDRPKLLLPKEEKANMAPLMLRGHYNPVWDFVDVKEVLRTAKWKWTKEELPESLQQPLIRSLGRTRSLFDLMSSWNKTTLQEFGLEAGPLVWK
ncbi:hypothetical protein MHUMG1_10178 [Metarhizium humberi]|uniref:Reverse transcriptase domain-containing protein n=1 Tax=Metarhizium humberi TaxID=2596975 RepID=A0A9P8S3F6_9HYPO|nr:hypothetical protein MHUMG1_10178 [Metarhizium humberi]